VKHKISLELFKNIQQLIQFIDQKSGAVLLVAGFILSAFLEISTKLSFNLANMTIAAYATLILGVITVLLLTYVIYIAIFKIIRPRSPNICHNTQFSLFYFKHLAIMDKQKIFEHFNNLNEETALNHLTDQIHEVSKILDQKILELHSAMQYLFLAIVALLAFVFVSRLM
jgi:hypothetical protein